MSRSIVVPAVVPSLTQSSEPDAAVWAAKTSLPLTAEIEVIAENAGPPEDEG
jgi:hypothetical protein